MHKETNCSIYASEKITGCQTRLIEESIFIIREKSNSLDEKPFLKQNQFPELKNKFPNHESKSLNQEEKPSLGLEGGAFEIHRVS